MTTETTDSSAGAVPAPTGTIVAKAGTYYRVTGIVMAVVMVGYGIWSIRDGFFSWPQQVAQERAHGQKESHNHLSILMNQVLGVVLPPAGIALLFWRLYNSRGEIRMENSTVHAPGHPPVPLDAITALDRRLWDRKGIAYLTYEVAGTSPRNLKLDDFVYQREPVDQIYQRVEKLLSTESQAPAS
jgi:hypothetical protein